MGKSGNRRLGAGGNGVFSLFATVESTGNGGSAGTSSSATSVAASQNVALSQGNTGASTASKGMAPGAIAGTVIGCIAAVGLVAALVVVQKKRQQQQKKTDTKTIQAAEIEDNTE